MATNEDNLLKTWTGWIDEPDNSGWDEDTIAHSAKEAFSYISYRLNEPCILAALWIRGEGVAFGSQARGISFTDRTTDQRLEALLPAHAPVLWQHVEFRTQYGSDQDPKWHAEDVAMLKAAKEIARKNQAIGGARYPANSMTIFGKYKRLDRERFVPPCKTMTLENKNKLIPGCEEVLRDVGISVYNPVA
jgi:hypothetical protein